MNQNEELSRTLLQLIIHRIEAWRRNSADSIQGLQLATEKTNWFEVPVTKKMLGGSGCGQKGEVQTRRCFTKSIYLFVHAPLLKNVRLVGAPPSFGIGKFWRRYRVVGGRDIRNHQIFQNLRADKNKSLLDTRQIMFHLNQKNRWYHFHEESMKRLMVFGFTIAYQGISFLMR